MSGELVVSPRADRASHPRALESTPPCAIGSVGCPRGVHREDFFRKEDDHIPYYLLEYKLNIHIFLLNYIFTRSVPMHCYRLKRNFVSIYMVWRTNNIFQTR
jgi:hypothetical protein